MEDKTKIFKPIHCEKCALYNSERISQDGPVNPDIALVGDFPKQFDLKKGAFFNKSDGIVRGICREIETTLKAQVSKSFLYAVSCCPNDEGYKVYAETFAQCSGFLKTYLDIHKPKVIVVFGTEAMHSLGIKGTVSQLRGGLYPYKYTGGGEAVVIPSYATYQVLKQPGLVPVMETDLRKAYTLVLDKTSTADFTLYTPTTVDGILQALADIRQQVDESRANGDKKPTWAISVDTETTGLVPSDATQRMIAISMSWGEDKGLAFPFEHQAVPFTPEEVQQIKEAVEETLSADRASLLMFNAKFDHQWLVLKYGFKIPFARYDGMLAEHMLEEDKKGNYSLKALTKDYFPVFGNYEEMLKEALALEAQRRNEAYLIQVKEKREERKALMLEYWLALPEDKRLSQCAVWLNKGYSLGNFQDLIQVKCRKVKGELVVLKRYQASVKKMLDLVKPEDLDVDLPGTEVPKPADVTFEDIPLDVLLKYAAIDAVMTRKIAGRQLPRFVNEEKAIKSIEKTVNGKLPTIPLKEAFYTHAMPLCEVLAEMEYGGVKIDRDRTQDYISTLTGTLAELEDQMFTSIGYRFNTSSSSPDLARILYEEKKFIPRRYSDKTGAPSTDAETLKELYDEHDDEFLKSLVTYRKIDKCVHTYLESWLARSAQDGRIHGSFNQIGTATYRLSSTKPNLQNVPFYLKEANLNLKALFIPDSDEYDFYDMDISNAEMRVLCAYSRDEAMITAFRNGLDLHCLTAAGISEYSYDDIYANKEDKTTDQYTKRQVSKKVNFGN